MALHTLLFLMLRTLWFYYMMIFLFVLCLTCFLGVLSLLEFLNHESVQFSILGGLPVADAIGAQADSL